MKRTCTAAVVAAGLVALGGGTASADESTDSDTTIVTYPMTTVAFDAEQAASVGNRIESQNGWDVLIDGSTGAEIDRLPQPGTVTTQATVYGNCGSSYVEISDVRGDRRVTFSTGFTLTSPAYDFDWFVSIEDNGGGYGGWSDSGPMFPDTVWDSGSQSRPIAGPGNAELVATGTAYTTTGRVCTSGNPTEVEYVS